MFYATVDYSEPYGSLTDRTVRISLKVLMSSVEKYVWTTFEVNLSPGRSNAVET